MKAKSKRKKAAKRPSVWRARWRWVLKRVLIVLVIAFCIPPLQVLVVRFVDPPLTVTMVEDMWNRSRATGSLVGVTHRSPPLSALGEVPRMALTAEDDAFFYHYGFDVGGICVAVDRNKRAGEVVAGGSTISQQTAKNVFLWQGRSWLRKGLETLYVGWMELLLPKERILELYLGVAEFGPAVYGAEAGAQHWFGRSAASLSQSEAARLVSVLPSPKTRSPAGPAASGKAARLMRHPAVFPHELGFEQIGERWRERSRSLCD